MSLVGIYPGRASNKVMTNYPRIALPKPNILILSRAPSNFLYICDNRRSLNVFPGHPTFCCTCKKRLALAWENSQHNCFPRKMRLRNSLLMILRVACYVSYLKTAEAAYQTVYKARFRRRSTHVPNPTEALSTAKERHLNQFGTAVLIWCNKNVKFNRVCRNIRHWSIKIRFDTRCAVWIRCRAKVAPKSNQTQLGSAHEWSGVWTRPNMADVLKFSKVCTFWKNISSFFGYNL